MSMTSDLMWDNAGRDLEAERLELARTAALSDAEPGVWPLVAAAVDERDLGHRLALAASALQTIAEQRGYTVQALTEDMTARWRLLAEANALQAPVRQAALQRTAAQENALDLAISKLAGKAAAENPLMPMNECMRLAAEAVTKVADASPLAWESWGHVADGPLTHRIKTWQPPKLPSPGAEDGLGGGSSAPTSMPHKPPRLDLTPSFSDAPGTDTPLSNRGERPGPSPFSHGPGHDTPLSDPAGTAMPSFSDPDTSVVPHAAPGAAAPATFSDTPPTHLSPAGPDGPAAGGFSDSATPHIAPPRPAGPPSMPTFSG